MKMYLVITLGILLSGCATQKNPVSSIGLNAKKNGQTVPSQSDYDRSTSRINECKKELAALKEFNPILWGKYQAEFDNISQETKKYIKVKEMLGEDINYLAIPKYQFSMRNVCFRIKTSLSNTIIGQIK